MSYYCNSAHLLYLTAGCSGPALDDHVTAEKQKLCRLCRLVRVALLQAAAIISLLVNYLVIDKQ
jgi:hypothetical protein